MLAGKKRSLHCIYLCVCRGGEEIPAAHTFSLPTFSDSWIYYLCRAKTNLKTSQLLVTQLVFDVIFIFPELPSLPLTPISRIISHVLTESQIAHIPPGTHIYPTPLYICLRLLTPVRKPENVFFSYKYNPIIIWFSQFMFFLKSVYFCFMIPYLMSDVTANVTQIRACRDNYQVN